MIYETPYYLDEDTGEIISSMAEYDINHADIRQAAKLRKNLEAQFDAINEARKTLIARLEKVSSAIEKIDNRIMEQVMSGNSLSLIYGEFTVKVKANPPAVRVLDEEAVPDEFIKIKVQKTVDKTAIKSAILSGNTVKGAELVYNNRVEIK